jgi:hypothetical protein
MSTSWRDLKPLTKFVNELISKPGVEVILRPVSTAEIAYALGAQVHNQPELEAKAQDTINKLPGAKKDLVKNAYVAGKSGVTEFVPTMSESDLREIGKRTQPPSRTSCPGLSKSQGFLCKIRCARKKSGRGRIDSIHSGLGAV